MTPLTPEELAERAAALPRVLADVAEESGDAALAALLRSPRLADAIAWASDEWRSVENDPPPVGEWVHGWWPQGRGLPDGHSKSGVCAWHGQRRWRNDQNVLCAVAPTWWRPLRLPPPPSEPRPADVECERCAGTGWMRSASPSSESWCTDCRGTGRVSPTQPPLGRTLFECRTCGNACHGFTDGAFDDPAWGRIEGIDGPNAICPECQARPEALEGLREDGYENARVAQPERRCERCAGGGPDGYVCVCGTGVAQPARST